VPIGLLVSDAETLQPWVLVSSFFQAVVEAVVVLVAVVVVVEEVAGVVAVAGVVESSVNK
jgi:hypothetical protein